MEVAYEQVIDNSQPNDAEDIPAPPRRSSPLRCRYSAVAAWAARHGDGRHRLMELGSGQHSHHRGRNAGGAHRIRSAGVVRPREISAQHTWRRSPRSAVRRSDRSAGRYCPAYRIPHHTHGRPLIVGGSAVRDTRGDVAAVCGVGGDITERKSGERKLRAAKEALEQSNRAKDVFIAKLAHEVRTPLTAGLGFAELVEDRLQDADDRSDLARIVQNGKYLQAPGRRYARSVAGRGRQ